MEENECFICFEVSNQYEKFPLRLNSDKDYIKNCSCDGWIHDNCLEIWYNTNKTCPICRNKMIYLNFDLQYGFYIIYYFVSRKKYIFIFIHQLVRMRNVFIFCIIIINIMNIISTSINNFKKTEYDNTYTAPQIL